MWINRFCKYFLQECQTDSATSSFSHTRTIRSSTRTEERARYSSVSEKEQDDVDSDYKYNPAEEVISDSSDENVSVQKTCTTFLKNCKS